jgi:hypothetical protein
MLHFGECILSLNDPAMLEYFMLAWKYSLVCRSQVNFLRFKI